MPRKDARVKISISVNHGDFLLRSCDRHLSDKGEHSTLEILFTTDASHLVAIAYWERHMDGFDLRFVGDRPFKYDKTKFFQLAEIGQAFLSAISPYDI
jgi:hypothetical protein